MWIRLLAPGSCTDTKVEGGRRFRSTGVKACLGGRGPASGQFLEPIERDNEQAVISKHHDTDSACQTKGYVLYLGSHLPPLFQLDLTKLLGRGVYCTIGTPSLPPCFFFFFFLSFIWFSRKCSPIPSTQLTWDASHIIVCMRWSARRVASLLFVPWLVLPLH